MMEFNTNQRKPRGSRAGSREGSRKRSSRTRVSKRGFRESVVEQESAQRSTAFATQVDDSEKQDPEILSGQRTLAENSSESKSESVGASIESVILGKTAARKQRNEELQRSRRYHDETRRPIVCLAFVMPFLLFYEAGSLWLSGASLRSGIDQWFHQALHRLGFGELVVLPIVTIAVMIVWHHRNDDHWKMRIPVITGMLMEAVGLGLILFWAANAINLMVGGVSAVAAETLISETVWWANMVTCVGSGIYEELIFRIMILLPLIIWANRLVHDRKFATVLGVVAVSLLFAAVHYNVFNPAGNQFELSSFMFRFCASIVFCVLFLFRGFGIAVGAHVAYDVLTQV